MPDARRRIGAGPGRHRWLAWCRDHAHRSEFLIDDALGQAHGGNLFHSFSTFNIAAQESAFFDTPPATINVIARVTGPSVSQIDGRLVTDANLYLLNPRGVMFGGNAQLDVAGSFHVSSADYLGFPGGERFYTSLGTQSALSIAAPTAFGLLDAISGPISVSASILDGADNTSFSFIGGNVTLDGADGTSRAGRLPGRQARADCACQRKLPQFLARGHGKVFSGESSAMLALDDITTIVVLKDFSGAADMLLRCCSQPEDRILLADGELWRYDRWVAWIHDSQVREIWAAN